jgi:hypothetical protein
MINHASIQHRVGVRPAILQSSTAFLMTLNTWLRSNVGSNHSLPSDDTSKTTPRSFDLEYDIESHR